MAGTEYATKEDIIQLMQSNQELRAELNELQEKVDKNESGKAYQHGAIKTLEERLPASSRASRISTPRSLRSRS